MRRTMPLLCLIALGSYALLLPSCAWNGHFDILGYTTQPNYETCYKTVRVPIFKNRIPLVATPAPGIEMDLTQAIIREIQLKTPYKIAQDNADTELTGVIVGYTKNLLNYTQQNTVREAETTLIVEIVWRDLHTGKVLTRRSRRPGSGPLADPRQALLPDELTAGAFTTQDSMLPPGSKPIPIPAVPRPSGDTLAGGGSEEFTIIDPQTREKAIPVRLQSVAQYRPELAESLTSALKMNVDRMAIQVISAMEKGW